MIVEAAVKGLAHGKQLQKTFDATGDLMEGIEAEELIQEIYMNERYQAYFDAEGNKLVERDGMLVYADNMEEVHSGDHTYGLDRDYLLSNRGNITVGMALDLLHWIASLQIVFGAKDENGNTKMGEPQLGEAEMMKFRRALRLIEL